MKISVFWPKFRVSGGDEMSTAEISINFAKNWRNLGEISIKREISAIF